MFIGWAGWPVSRKPFKKGLFLIYNRRAQQANGLTGSTKQII